VAEDAPRPNTWVPFWRVAGIAFIAYPIVRILIEPTVPWIAVLVLAATAIFAFIVFALARRDSDDPRRASLVFAGLDIAIMVIAAVIVLGSPNTGWVLFLYFASTAASMLLPERRALALIALSGIVSGALVAASDDVANAAIQGLSVSVIGLTVYAITALRRTNVKLHAAQQELSSLAVAEERDRIARDLHDVLGHSLSLIAIKSELAGRLVGTDPDRARAEIGDVERVARESLASVRETVSGYRQPTLDGELAEARATLDAAGIEPTIDNRVGPLSAADDAVLAWAVREAVTNMVRHSGARHGAIRTSRRGGLAEVDVVDDGTSPATDATDGSGLRGLSERLAQVGGRLEAGSQPTGGYRLTATIPVSTAESRPS
jgi:two-component system sensor histidine kinase DesK